MSSSWLAYQHRLRSPLVAIGAAAIVILALAPIAWVVVSSFQPLRNLLGPPNDVFRLHDVTLGGYRELFADGFLRWAFNSMFVVGAAVIANVVFDSLAAYALARMRFRGQWLALGAIIASIMVPAQVIVVPLYLEMKNWGLLNTYWALILPYLASPTGIFLLRQHFMTIPKELDEAAAVDGAGAWRTFVRIILPNSKAALGTVATLKFIWTWGEYAWPSLAVNADSMKTIPVGLTGLQGQFSTNWPVLMAGSVLAALPPIILFLALQRWFVEGLTAGAVKG